MAQEKNRAMNARVDAYFNRAPPPETSSIPPPLAEADDEDANTAASPSDTSSEGHGSLRRSPTSERLGFFKRVRTRSKRMSVSLFK
jgi:hypothetical protein